MMKKTLPIIAIVALLMNAGCTTLRVSQSDTPLPSPETIAEVEQQSEAGTENVNKEEQKEEKEDERKVGMFPMMVGSAVLGGIVAFLVLIVVLSAIPG